MKKENLWEKIMKGFIKEPSSSGKEAPEKKNPPKKQKGNELSDEIYPLY